MKNFMNKFILGAVCFMVIATGSGIQQSAHAATSNAVVKDNVVSASSTKAQKKAAIVAYAKSLKGKVKYKFGVNNPRKLIFDCSSFTKYVFSKQGISLKWGAAAQGKQGYYVAKKNLQVGDLVFFSVSKPGKINHVGIYIGGGKFIHDTIGKSFNGILISKLANYSKRYITARRVG